jgi:hypothetical protein
MGIGDAWIGRGRGSRATVVAQYSATEHLRQRNPLCSLISMATGLLVRGVDRRHRSPGQPVCHLSPVVLVSFPIGTVSFPIGTVSFPIGTVSLPIGTTASTSVAVALGIFAPGAPSAHRAHGRHPPLEHAGRHRGDGRPRLIGSPAGPARSWMGYVEIVFPRSVQNLAESPIGASGARLRPRASISPPADLLLSDRSPVA